MKYVTTVYASSVVLALALAGSASAGDTPGFSELDADGDGYLTKQESESRSGLVESWEQNDANGDSQIDQAEFSAFEASEGGSQSEPMQQDNQYPQGGESTQ